MQNVLQQNRVLDAIVHKELPVFSVRKVSESIVNDFDQFFFMIIFIFSCSIEIVQLLWIEMSKWWNLCLRTEQDSMPLSIESTWSSL